VTSIGGLGGVRVGVVSGTGRWRVLEMRCDSKVRTDEKERVRLDLAVDQFVNKAPDYQSVVRSECETRRGLSSSCWPNDRLTNSSTSSTRHAFRLHSNLPNTFAVRTSTVEPEVDRLNQVKK
jgi:hypothetical protein